MAIISINNGYFATKVKTDTKEFMFESKVQPPIDGTESNTVCVEGKKLVVGTGNTNIDLDKTNSIVQKACIVNALDRGQIDFAKVISALPVNTYINTKAREEYLKWISLIPGVIDCKVYMEGASAVLADYNWYKNRLVCLLDIGGLTINAMIFDDGKLIKHTANSFKLGTIILENRLKKALEQTELCNIPEYQLKYLLKDGSNKMINRIIDCYIDELKEELRKLEYPTNIEYRCTGGGAIKYGNIFKETFNAYISQDAVWENVRGLYMMGKVIWDEKNNLF